MLNKPDLIKAAVLRVDTGAPFFTCCAKVLRLPDEIGSADLIHAHFQMSLEEVTYFCDAESEELERWIDFELCLIK